MTRRTMMSLALAISVAATSLAAEIPAELQQTIQARDEAVTRKDEVVKSSPDLRPALHFEVVVCSDGFVGACDFSVMERELHRFVWDLPVLDQSLSGETMIQCGWGDLVHLSLECFALDTIGHLRAKVEVCTSLAVHRWHWIRAKLDVEAASLARSADGIRKVTAAYLLAASDVGRRARRALSPHGAHAGEHERQATQ